MKLNNKIVDGVIEEAVGKDSVVVVKSIKNKKNVSEFKIAEATGLQINETRNILYRLYHANLVSFVRRKDKKKGWYIYYWTFNPKRIKYLFANLKKQRFERLSERLAREKSNQFYACKRGCVRLSFEQAMDFTYKCPECGELMNLEDNTEKIAALEEELQELKKELKKQ